MRLTGPQYEHLMNAILEAYPTQASLAQMLRFRLNKQLDSIALGTSLQDIVFRLIATAEAENWLAELIIAARDLNPANLSLLRISEEVSLAPLSPPTGGLERIIKATNSFLDVSRWRDRLAVIEGQVCRIEISTSRGTAFGTGFLIAPDLVMTAYHVIECILAGEGCQTIRDVPTARREDVVIRFDYRRLPNDALIHPGTEYSLAEKNWLVDSSPYALGDLQPALDELDYAILRTKGAPGNDPIGVSPDPGAATRGHIPFTTPTRSVLHPNSSLFIVQHPQGDVLKLAIDTDAIIGVNENGTLVKYRTNTLPGSSGSPCFSNNWDLVALHHSGDPAYRRPEFNAGTPISAIISLLDSRGKSELVA